MPRSWSVEGDVLNLGPLRLAVQRIGRSHWAAGVALRSWGPVPLHPDGEALRLPCAAGEALWLGVWLEPQETPAPAAVVALSDPDRGAATRIVLPDRTQLAALDGPDGPRPIARDAGRPESPPLVLDLEVGDARVRLILLLEDPAAWAARAGRPPPPPLQGPPPLPPRLG